MSLSQRQTVIETVSLTKTFKDFWGRNKVRAVCDLNLQIHKGEVFGLLGPNGSGKTTTIKILLGLLYPTSGRARIFEKSPTNVEVKSRIGYLPEETRLYQFLDSLETLDFYGRIFNLEKSERDKRTEALVDMVGLGPAASRPVGQYSKGMARRIGLAQSLINDPDLLILDEPTSGLDPIGTRQIKDLLIELKKRGKTILLSSHLLADVEDVCDRVAIMYGGKLLCCGPIEELLAQQDMTQILTENLQADQLSKLGQYLEHELGCKVISVGSPRDRLERFFLRMVQQAQSQMGTSGALAGGKVSEFLRGSGEADTGKALLQKLMAEEELSPESRQVAQDISKPQPQTVQRDVLEQLVTEQKAEPELPQSPLPDPTRREPLKQEQIDRNLLDGLTKHDRPNGSGG
ncbi:MAG: ABC transporter ATP-binding protein [Phycisphaerae bacterium]